ncbi:MAG: type IV pilin protein [Gammaproteobacteria bacterium]
MQFNTEVGFLPKIRKIKIYGFTIVELMIAMAIAGLLMMIAVPAYQDYTTRIDDGQAEKDIIIIQLTIDDYQLTTGSLPNSLNDVGMNGMEDPWGNAYVYANHDVVPPGHRRKDHSLVPINSDYDLYSKGEDGRTTWPLTANHSKDDIIRARDGGYIGIAEDY